MIAIDTSTWIAFFGGVTGADVSMLETALESCVAILPPVVLTELFSDSRLPKSFRTLIESLPQPEITEGYWKRAGALRAKILGKGRKARLADTLIAQYCLDLGCPLVTRDRDFKAFEKWARLNLLVG